MKSKPNSPIEQFKNFVRNKYAWPGGYPMLAVMHDGGVLCHKCAKENAKQVINSTHYGDGSGWELGGVDVNWECDVTHCDNCGERIPSAYGEDE